MTNGERVTSAINDPDLVWTGPLTNAWSPVFLKSPAKAIINSPGGIAGFYDAQTADFGPSVASPTTADVALVDDGIGTARDGCETPFINAGAVAGKIALIERGACNFTVKVKNAQLNGAVGALIFNNVASGLPGMGGSDSTITIPSLGVTQALGLSIVSTLPTTVNATLASTPLRRWPVQRAVACGCSRQIRCSPVRRFRTSIRMHSRIS